MPSRPANISQIFGHIQLIVYGLPSALVTLQGSVVGTPVTRPTDYTAGDFGYLIAVRQLHGQRLHKQVSVPYPRATKGMERTTWRDPSG